ncbi:hypothetical protein XENTR_v10013479 [Xenopus tropicalis]|uniref:Filensin n=1 Tax=Xenopus tropicalis TaxID=8364 RepID=F6U013_XENTR|nr:filensin [Xenopus tropicalis]KAE8600967.1 hypothetical protein XENTR_v10013479 [Xenopus tropicalis]|eukprot:XP_002931790.1 PREDICTED: filensin [Xenopus tropicalis]
MYKSSYRHEVRKDKYERSDAFDEQKLVDFGNLGLTQVQGLENLHELNERFANYINRARVLEQRNGIFRKQLETFQRMDEISGLEEAFEEQIELNQQRIRELASDRSRLEREYKDAQRMVEEFKNKYKNECEHQLHLKDTLENLNKEADEALLSNLELQIQSQFLQDDINAAKERYKKNLMEIQTYVSILQQIIQTTPRVAAITAGIGEEKLISERRIPILQSQLEEYKSILSQLQAQKLKLQSETSVLEETIKSTQESYDDEIQLYNEQIEVLKKGMEEVEKSLEKLMNDCRQLSIYQQSLEHELERYKRIIENEDHRLNSAIVGTPITLFMQSVKSSQMSTTRGRDITLAIQDIATAKPRQKMFQRKMLRRKEIPCIEISDINNQHEVLEKDESSIEKGPTESEHDNTTLGEAEKDLDPFEPGVSEEDVPDGAQISKAFNKLYGMVRGRMITYTKPEPTTELFAKSRYVLVTGESSYEDPCFCSSSTQTGGRVNVSIIPYVMPGNDILPIPGLPEPFEPSDSGDDEANRKDKYPDKPEDVTKFDDEEERKNKKGKQTKGKYKALPIVIIPDGGTRRDYEQPQIYSPGANNEYMASQAVRDADCLHSMSYEKVEVVESIEKISDDSLKSYEETATIVETVIEKTRKK